MRLLHKKFDYTCQIVQCNFVTAFKYLQNTFSTSRFKAESGHSDKKHLVQLFARHDTEMNWQHKVFRSTGNSDWNYFYNPATAA